MSPPDDLLPGQRGAHTPRPLVLFLFCLGVGQMIGAGLGAWMLFDSGVNVRTLGVVLCTAVLTVVSRTLFWQRTPKAAE